MIIIPRNASYIAFKVPLPEWNVFLPKWFMCITINFNISSKVYIGFIKKFPKSFNPGRITFAQAYIKFIVNFENLNFQIFVRAKLVGKYPFIFSFSFYNMLARD